MMPCGSVGSGVELPRDGDCGPGDCGPGSCGLLVVLSSPSGAGKTSVCRRLLVADPRLVLSVSATTRSPRPLEVEGEDYFFLSPGDFRKKVHEGGFLEHARVFDNWYGTPRDVVESWHARGRDVLFDVDWQGARAISQKMSSVTVRIFILPPSIQELEVRLRGRGQDTDDIVRKRMLEARREISHWAEYDYVLVNKDLDETVQGVQSILQAERLKRIHQPNLFDWIRSLEDGISQAATAP